MTREEAIKVLSHIIESYKTFPKVLCKIPHAEEQKNEYVDALKVAIEALTAEAVQGEWVWSDEDASWMCGACCCVFEEIDWKPNYNFCPNCGAKMVGEDGEA